VSSKPGAGHSAEFEKYARADDVIDAAEMMSDYLNGILYLKDAGRQPLRVNGVYERQSDGRWGSGIVFGSAHFVGASRMRVIPSGTGPMSQERWMKAALEDQKISDVLAYLRGEPDWFELYKAHETIGAPSDKFTETAQAVRHSKDWCRRKGVRRHMSIEEAREHVRLLARNWLEFRSRKT